MFIDLSTDELVTLAMSLEEYAKQSVVSRGRSFNANWEFVAGKENKDLHRALALREKVNAELERRKST